MFDVMARPTDDPKPHRIAVRVNDRDLALLRAEARRKRCTVGAVLRRLILTLAERKRK